MARIISILTLMILVGGVLAASYFDPRLLSDTGNPLLADFVDHQMLSVLGVIVTITLASAANLHLELNRLEDTHGEAFPEARRATKSYAYMLILLFGVAMALVVLKPMLPSGYRGETLINGGALVIIFLNILALNRAGFAGGSNS